MAEGFNKTLETFGVKKHYYNILKIVAKKGKNGKDQKKIVEESDRSKSTVSKTLSDFEDRNLVKKKKKSFRGRPPQGMKKKRNKVYITSKGMVLFRSLKQINESLLKTDDLTIKEEKKKKIEQFTKKIKEAEEEEKEEILSRLSSYVGETDSYVEGYRNDNLFDFIQENIDLNNPAIQDKPDYYIQIVILYLGFWKEALNKLDELWVEEGNKLDFFWKFLLSPDSKKGGPGGIKGGKSNLSILLSYYYSTEKSVPEDYLERLIDKFLKDCSSELDWWKNLLLNEIKNREDQKKVKHLIEEKLEREDINPPVPFKIKQNILKKEPYLSIFSDVDE